MKKLFYLITITLLVINSNKLIAQDFIRIGVAHDFKKSKIVQTFSFDLNRTEKIDEKVGSYLTFSHDNFYILPSIDFNVGDGVSSSENNILVQLNIGKAYYGKLNKSDDNIKTSVWNKSIEFNPSYNSDKLFNEKLSFGQLKFLFNYISSKHNIENENIFVEKSASFSLGLFSNIGGRFSKTFDKTNLYSTVGVLLDFKARILDSTNTEKWIYKLTGNYYQIVSDIDEIAIDNYGGVIKTSIDKLFYKKYYLSISYKYGNDNPTYNYFNTLELSVKIKY